MISLPMRQSVFFRRQPFGNLTLPKFLMSNEGTILESFENDADWTGIGGTTFSDNTEHFEGSQSVDFIAGGSGYARGYKLITWPGGVATPPYMRIYGTPGPASLTIANAGLTKWAQANGTAGGGSTIVATYGLWRAGNYIPSDWTSYNGFSWTTDPARLQLNFGSMANGATATSDYLRVGFTSQPALMVSFSGGSRDIYLNAFPALKTRRARANFHMVTNEIGPGASGNCTVDDMLDMQDEGWTVGHQSSTQTPYLTTLTQAEVETALTTAKDQMEAWGLNGIHMSFPGGLVNTTVMAAMTNVGIVSGRTVNSGTLMVPMPDWRSYASYSCIASTTLETAKGWIDACFARKELTCITFHGIALTGATQNKTNLSTFCNIVDYAIQKHMPLITIEDVFDLHNGTVTIPAQW